MRRSTYTPALARSLAGCSGFSTNETIRPLGIELGDPAGPGIGGAEQDHGERIVVAAMKRKQRTEARYR